MTTQTAVEEQTAQIVALKDSVDALLASVTGITDRANNTVATAEGIVTANADLSAAIAAANAAVAAATAAAGNVTDTVNAAATNAATAVQTDFAGQLAAAQALVEAAQAQIDALDGVGGSGWPAGTTWRSASRVTGDAMQNTASAPVQVAAILNASASASFEVSDDMATWITLAIGNASAMTSTGAITVAAGAYYRATGFASLTEFVPDLTTFVPRFAGTVDYLADHTYAGRAWTPVSATNPWNIRDNGDGSVTFEVRQGDARAGDPEYRDRAELTGDGFDIAGDGQTRFTFSATVHIDDLSGGAGNTNRITLMQLFERDGVDNGASIGPAAFVALLADGRLRLWRSYDNAGAWASTIAYTSTATYAAGDTLALSLSILPDPVSGEIALSVGGVEVFSATGVPVGLNATRAFGPSFGAYRDWQNSTNPTRAKLTFSDVAFATEQGNRAPVATDDVVAVDYETPLTFDVLSNDTDADGDTLTVTGATASVGSVVVNGDYTLTYTPPAGFDGAVTITYTISDGQGGTDTGTVNLTVATDPADPYAIPTRTFTFAEVDALHNTAGPLVDPTLTVGVDTLPAGCSISGDVLYIGADAVLDGWIIEGYRVVFSSGDAIMRNCHWTQADAADYIQGFLHEADAGHCQIINNRIIGNGTVGLLSSLIKQQTSGSGAAATCGDFLTVKDNWIAGCPADGIKIAGRALIEGNYFDTPANLPYDPPAYDSGATYAAGDYVYDATRTYAYESAIDANTGNALPTGKTDNASWTNVDPHADFINPFARINGRVVIRGNKIQRSNAHRLYGSGYGHGVNNGIRLNPNTGGTFGFYGADVYNNIVAGGEDKSAYAVDFASQAQIDTITAAGSVWEADSVTDNWFGANSSGLWYSGGVPPASESGNVIYAQPAPVIPAVFAVLGQSENEVAMFARDNYYTQGPYPALLSGVDAQLVSSQQGVAPWRQVVDAAAVSGRNISPGFVAFANLWHVATGRPLRMIDVAKPGTGFNAMMRDTTDATDDRVFADDAATVALGIQHFGPIDRIVYNWFNAEASAAKTLWDSRSMHFFGINTDGTDADMATADLQHCLIDVTGRGYGLLDAADGTKVDLMLAGQRIMDATATVTEWNNYLYDSTLTRTNGMLYQNAEPQVAQRHAAIANFPLAHRGKVTITPSVSRFGDYQGGAALPDPSQTSIHPAMQHADGQQLFAQHVCASFLVAEGYIDAPVVDRIEWATDGSYADMVVSLPTGTTLTTMRLRAAEAVASPRPHQQEVIGFVVRRVGDGLSSERPLFRSAATTYPAAYRGSAVIHDTGSDNGGAWEAVVRITPDEPFENGDQIGFGMDGGYPHCILSGAADYDARLYRDALIAHVPAWDGAGYPGLPVQPQFAGVASGITVVVAPEPTDRLTTDGAAYFLAPSGPGAGVTKATNQGTFNVTSISGSYVYLFAQTSTGNDLQMMNTRELRVSKVEDGTGAAVVTTQYVKLGGVNYTVPAGDFTIVMVTDWAAGAVNVTVNGIVMDTINFATAGNGLMQSTREMAVGAFPSGTYALPAGSKIKDASILLNDVAYKTFPNDAAAANTDGWKAGTGVFS